MSNSNGNLVLGGYSIEDIQSMVAILLASGKIVINKNAEPLTDPALAMEIANTAARWGVHPLAMSNMIVHGRLVTVPPMDALYSWERDNGGITRSEYIYTDTDLIEYKKKVKAISVVVYGVRNNNISEFQSAYESNLALFSQILTNNAGVDSMQNVIKLAKLEAFKMHGIKGEGVASVNELGRVKGRSINFVAEKRANSDLIIKCFGRPTPVHIATRFAKVRQMLNSPSSYEDVPHEWTVEQKQIASEINQHHAEFVALPRDEQRKKAAYGRALLRDSVDPITEDPYTEPTPQPKFPTREQLLTWVENLNQLEQVAGYYNDPKHVQNATRLEWPTLDNKEAWSNLKAKAIEHADYGNYKNVVASLEIDDDNKNAMLKLFDEDRQIAWETVLDMKV